jgi:NAD(P)-dependent dehydrogenase (short-subunit alcohol dehydrogenase family)
VARRLAQDGPVVGLDVDPAVQEIGASLALVADATEAGAAEAAVGAAVEAFGGLDVLVPAAGVVVRHVAEEVSDEEWERVLAVNLTHVFRFCRAALPALRASSGCIVTIGSGWGLTAGPRAVSYAATKGAVVNLTRALAIDHGPEGIRVNCVCPGDTDTPMLRGELEQLGADVEAGIAESAAGRPLRRLGTAEEVAAAVAWLASDEARYVTGTTLVVDGGGLAAG